MEIPLDDVSGPKPKPAWRARGVAFAIGLALATGVAGLAGRDADNAAGPAALAGILGPFAGAYLRGWQGCCLDASRQLAIGFCGPALAAGLAAPCVPTLRATRAGRLARGLAWTLGWGAWFLGVPASLLHALG